MIKKVGNKYKLYAKDGSRVLGTHSSKASALRQERAINMRKHGKGTRSKGPR